jgi:prepilin peptidase CpaA
MIQAAQTLIVLTFPILLIVAALRDLTSYTIPNRLSFGLAGLFPVAALAAGLPPSLIGLNLAVGLAALVAGMVMFALRWIGGGDAKLFAAAALWLGWPAMLTDIAVTGLAGGALAVMLLALRSAHIRPFVPVGATWLGRLAEPGENVPYGVAIAAGALAAFPASSLMQALGHGL